MAFLYPWKGSSVAIRTPARKSSPRSSSQFSCAVPDLPGTRSNKRAVGCSSPRVRSTMPVNSRGPRRRRSWRCHTCSSTPNTCTPAKRAVFRCGLQTRLDVGPHGIPRGCQLSGQSCDGGSFEAQLSDRPADRPGPQTRPGCAHRVVLLDKGRDLAGGFAAYPASFMPPDTRRDPGPGRVDHLHHHTTVALSDHPTTRAANQLVARLNIEHQNLWGASHAHQMEALQTDEQITPITPIKRRTAAGRVRHRPRF